MKAIRQRRMQPSLLIGVLSCAGMTVSLMQTVFVPIGMSIMRDELPREKLSYSVALMSATLGIGAAIGLPFSGIIFAHFGWRAVFWVSAILATVMLTVTFLVVPESDIRTGGRFDLFGAIFLSVVLVSFLLGITKGGSWGWTSTSTSASFVAAAILFALWLPWESRVSTPLVDLKTSMGRPVLISNFASFLIVFSMYCNMLTTTEVLQMPPATGYGFGLSTIRAGLAMLPAGVAMALLASVSAPITKRFGPKMTLMIGAQCSPSATWHVSFL